MTGIKPFGDGPLRVSLVGAGFVAPIHLRGWQRIPGVHVSSISSRTREKTEKIAVEFGVERVFDDVTTMLDTDLPDVFDICSSVETHLEFVKIAAARGIHVICQKPIAEDWETAMEIADVAEQAGIRLMVHENFRFRPWHREIKRQLDSGVIGQPFYCRSDARMAGTVVTHDNPDEAWSLKRQPFFKEVERFLVLESVIHQIDVCRFLFGDVRRIFARTRKISPCVKGEDLASLVLDFDDLHAVVERSYASKGYPSPPMVTEVMAIEGEMGTLFLEPDGQIRIEIDTPSKRATRKSELDLTNAYPNSYGATIEHFVSCLRHGRPFETDIRDNIRTLKATLAAYESATSKEVVTLSYEN